MGKTILVVDDEKPIVDILKFNLSKEGYDVLEAFDGEQALEAAKAGPDLILLDVMLPRLDGFSVCRKIREKSAVPILMLTAREEEVDKVLGLELGADDYITKPFSVRELMARVKANLRRSTEAAPEGGSSGAGAGDVARYHDLEINFARYEVKKRGNLVELTIREFELLKYLSGQPDKIFSRETLLEQVWGYEYYGDVRTVDVTVRRLREKIEDDPSAPAHIMTKRGVGYYFNR